MDFNNIGNNYQPFQIDYLLTSDKSPVTPTEEEIKPPLPPVKIVKINQNRKVIKKTKKIKATPFKVNLQNNEFNPNAFRPLNFEERVQFPPPRIKNENINNNIIENNHQTQQINQQEERIIQNIESLDITSDEMDIEAIYDREYKVVEDSYIVYQKILNEFYKVQVARQSKGDKSFGKDRSLMQFNLKSPLMRAVNNTPQLILNNQVKCLENTMWVEGISFEAKMDCPAEGQLIFNNIVKPSNYWMICEGFGEEGLKVATLVSQRFPIIFKSRIEKIEQIAAFEVWNALKLSCTDVNKEFGHNIKGGAIMVFSIVMVNFLWTINVGGRGSAFLLKGDRAIPLTRKVDLSHEDFYRSVQKRGGTIYLGDVALRYDELDNLHKNNTLSLQFLTVNKFLKHGRAFGWTEPSIYSVKGNKIITARGKITRIDLNDLKDDHLVVQYSKGVEDVASQGQIADLIQNGLEQIKTLKDVNIKMYYLRHLITRHVLAVKEGEKSDITLQIFNASKK